MRKERSEVEETTGVRGEEGEGGGRGGKGEESLRNEGGVRNKERRPHWWGEERERERGEVGRVCVLT